jgi:hypothetical protein
MKLSPRTYFALLVNCTLHQLLIAYQVEGEDMGGARSTHGGDENALNILVVKR